MLSRTHIIPLCLCLVLLLTGCSGYPQSDGERNPAGALDLSGKWRIITGDMPEASRADYDDSKAPQVDIPGKWESVLHQNRDMAATVWLRKDFHLGESQRENLMVLSLGTISISDEAYINGVRVGGTGYIPSKERPRKYDFTWHRERNYTVPVSLLRPGGRNVIALRIFSHYLNGMRDRPVLYTQKEFQRTRWLRDYLPSLNDITPLIFSLILSLMLTFVALGKVNTRVHLFAALFVVSVFGLFLLLLGMPPLSDGLYRYKLFFSIYSLVDLFLLLATLEFFRVTTRKPLVLILIAALGLNLLIVFSPDTRFFFQHAVLATVAFLILCIAYALYVFTEALLRDPRRYWFIAPIALLVVASAANTYYLLATEQMYRISFVFIFRLTALVLAALLYFLFDFKRIEKERDSLSRALVKKTRELSQARNRIPMDNRREDPRDAIHRLIEHIDGNYTETYDRARLAQRFGLNEDYMGQLFKKVTGTNIAQYINDRRIAAARQLLDETDSKVIDIAFHVGFDNLTYFYRHFKRVTGYNPTEYRKNRRETFANIEFKNEGEYY